MIFSIISSLSCSGGVNVEEFNAWSFNLNFGKHGKVPSCKEGCMENVFHSRLDA